MKKQILVIHGGDVQKSYEDYLEYLRNYEVNIEKVKDGGWKDYLQKNLGDEYEVIYPQMENYYNAKYLEWKIWFEKFIPFVRDNVILLGGSLGGIFLAKYLSENNFPVKIKATFLVAAPFDEKDRVCFLGDFNLPDSLDKFRDQGGQIFLYHSEDDPVVPFADLEKYSSRLPNAQKIIFKDRGHFNSKEFPEIIEKLKSIE